MAILRSVDKPSNTDDKEDPIKSQAAYVRGRGRGSDTPRGRGGSRGGGRGSGHGSGRGSGRSDLGKEGRTETHRDTGKRGELCEDCWKL